MAHIPPLPVPLIRKIPHASYPSLPEGRQNGNHKLQETNQTDHLDHSFV